MKNIMKKLDDFISSTTLISLIVGLTSVYFVLQQKVWAHHTKDHLMLQADPQQVIEGIQQGMVFSWSWMIWFLVFFLIVIGIIRQWKK